MYKRNKQEISSNVQMANFGANSSVSSIGSISKSSESVIIQLDDLIFIEYDDGVFRWVNSMEADRLNKQDKEMMELFLKVQKTTLIFYFSTLYVPFSLLTINANTSLKNRSSSNPFNNEICIQKVDTNTNCETFDTFPTFGKIYDYRPMSLRNKNKKNNSKSFGRSVSRSFGVGRSLSTSSNSDNSISIPKSRPVFISDTRSVLIEKPIVY